MHPAYAIANVDEVFSPALVFYADLIRSNIAEVVRMAGSADRLCPHVKTHKCREIVKLQLDAGIRSHKCATVAEAEMLAQCGVPDVIIAYPVVGPNIGRVKALATTYRKSSFTVLCDDPNAATALSAGWAAMLLPLPVMLDLNVGQDRTGIAVGPSALALYEYVARSPNLTPAGLHVYDGHNNQESLADRESAVRSLLANVLALRKSIEGKGLTVPRIICGGTPSFPVWAKIDFPGMQCSPGTYVLYDRGYGAKYPELAGFQAAALVVTRVVSKPLPNRITLDLGHKAIAADPPAGKRLTLLDVPEFSFGPQNEEHLCVDVPDGGKYKVGDVLFAIPTHVCPTVALHRWACVVEANRFVGTWEIAARDRVLTV